MTTLLVHLLAIAIRFLRALIARRGLSVQDRRVGSWSVYCVPFMHPAARITRVDYLDMMVNR